jgi:hypothetical protein
MSMWVNYRFAASPTYQEGTYNVCQTPTFPALLIQQSEVCQLSPISNYGRAYYNTVLWECMARVASAAPLCCIDYVPHLKRQCRRPSVPSRL